MGDLTADFSREEFACPCCGEASVDMKLVAVLQNLRSRYGKPLGITKGGGFRCEKYAPEGLSAHKEGLAVDLSFPKQDLFRLLELALMVGFTGVGIKNHGGHYQLHLDVAPPLKFRPRPVIWTYP